MNLPAQFQDVKLPMLIAVEEQDNFTVGLVSKDKSIKIIYQLPESLISIMNKAVKLLDLADISEALLEGDETFHMFNREDHPDNFLITEHLLKQLSTAKKEYLAKIDPSWSAELQAEMTHNINLDLAASFIDALIEQILLSLIGLAQDLILDNIAFVGEFTYIPRVRNILTQELNLVNIATHFPIE